jgi:hypothetical protein
MAPSAFFLVALALWAANILKAKAEAAAKAPKPKAPGAASPAPAKQ